ncbi:MAG: 50S ribosomal protein L10 [Leptospirales bacterium]|nr:50S ribosomal protein L10 [Leptospirales bacterium]
MVKQYKIDEVESLVAKLKDKKNIILTNYSGIKVRSLGVLRNNLRAKDADYKVVKNNLFKRALEKAGYINIDQHLKGPIGVTFLGDQIAETAKVLKEFGETQEKFSFSAGILDSVLYNQEQMKRIADLPSKEVLLSQVMSLLNGPASGVAMGTNQIMASLARGIKAVAEKNA